MSEIIEPVRVLSPKGRFVFWGSKQHKKYMKEGLMVLPKGFVIYYINNKKAIYKLK